MNITQDRLKIKMFSSTLKIQNESNWPRVASGASYYLGPAWPGAALPRGPPCFAKCWIITYPSPSPLQIYHDPLRWCLPTICPVHLFSSPVLSSLL